MLDYFTTSLRNEFRAAGFLRLLRKSLGIMPGQPDNFIPPLRIKVVETACCLPDGPVISLKKRGSNHPARSPGRRFDGRPLCDAHQDYVWRSGIQLEKLAISEIKIGGKRRRKNLRRVQVCRHWECSSTRHRGLVTMPLNRSAIPKW